MAGETDLTAILDGLTVARRPGRFTVVTLADGAAPPSLAEPGIEAVMAETEGTTVVVAVAEAEARGWRVDYVAAWLTIEIHSSLEAVGLTAAVSTALAAEGIPANVLAAYHHDHLLVPADKADRAIEALHRLRSRG
ncbi:MAG: ACT domain-containing protein [Actinomycetota bacterium]